jgi:hypothetical protein
MLSLEKTRRLSLNRVTIMAELPRKRLVQNGYRLYHGPPTNLKFERTAAAKTEKAILIKNSVNFYISHL